MGEMKDALVKYPDMSYRISYPGILFRYFKIILVVNHQGFKPFNGAGMPGYPTRPVIITTILLIYDLMVIVLLIELRKIERRAASNRICHTIFMQIMDSAFIS